MDIAYWLEDIVPEEEEIMGAPKMVRIDFAVPEPLLNEMLAISRSHGWKPAEFHRMLWVNAAFAYVEQSNKLLVNIQLRQKLLQK